MKDFVGVRDVISSEQLMELSEKSNGPALVRLSSHWGAILINGYLMTVYAGTVWCIPLFMLQGVLINFLYAPEHECDHYTAFKTRWINTWVARICGFLIIFNSEYHRGTHYYHHRHTQDWDEDPEIAARDRLDSVRAYLVALSGIKNIWTGRIVIMARHTFGFVDETFLSDNQKRKIVSTARWYSAGYSIIFLTGIGMQSWWPIYLWLGPFVAMRWVYWLQGLGEHFGLTHEDNTLLNTRTIKTNAFMRWVNWNMAYHTAHHTFPSVPFHRLPELHREIEDRLGYPLPSESYFKLHWGYIKDLYRGRSEMDICDTYTREMRQLGRL